MPYACKEHNGKHRLINTETNEIATREGSPIDGGGHDSPEACQKQAKAVMNREKNSPRNNPKGQKRLRNPRGRR